MKRLFTLLSLAALSITAFSQEWVNVHFLEKNKENWSSVEWTIPLKLDDVRITDVKQNSISFHVGDSISPFAFVLSPSVVDSIKFAEDLPDSLKGHNKYRSFAMYIFTNGKTSEINKETWTDAYIMIDGRGEYSDFSGCAQIKGRGNSTWEWYDKKPYKIKLGEKSKLLGLEKAKNWNLLANYRDVTDMMNVYAFECARFMGMPNTNHTRFVEMYINGVFNGLYQLTEKIEVGKKRVNIDEEGGVLMSFDLDDGPSLSPDATNNFWSEIYSLPMCVKHPDEPSAEKLQEVKADFAILENAVKARDFTTVNSLMDVPSFIGILQLHEYLFNVEIDAPRSLYMYKDKDGKYTFGPVWDWDAGYDFDWGDMYTGHTFFSDYKELIYGTAPAKGIGASYNINGFWKDMFADSTFVKMYKEKWAALSDSLHEYAWGVTSRFVEELNKGAYTRDTETWPLKSSSDSWFPSNNKYFTPAEELSKMQAWLQNRKSYLDQIISGYPDQTGGDTPSSYKVVGTINKTAECTFSSGYSQSGSIDVTKQDIKNLLGGSPTSLVPLNADGSEGNNTAAGTYGAWFDSIGNTTSWGSNSHIYIESNDMYSWSFGCHPSICSGGDKHTVTMQFRKDSKAVNVIVEFTIK